MEEERKKRVRKCGLYIRVSTVGQAIEKEGSLKNQQERLQAFIEHKNKISEDEHWEVVRTYMEKAKSGASAKRPEYQKMIRDIREGIIDTLICTKLDRVSRSLPDFYKLAELFEKHKVTFVSLRENFDTSTAQGRAFLKMTLILAEFERELTSERTSANMRARAERGLWNGGYLLGYDLHPEKKGYLVPNKKEAALVKFMFETYLKTGSIIKTTQILNEKGYRTKSYTSRRGMYHPPQKFSYTSVKQALQNKAYIGLKEINKRTMHLPQEELPENKRYKVVKSVWKPIIDKKTFDKVQKLLEENEKKKKNSLKRTKHPYLLSGLIRCANCGSLLDGVSANGRNGTYYYYGHKSKELKPDCNFRRFSADEVDKIVLQQIRKIATDQKLISDLVRKANEKIQTDYPALKEKQELLRKDLDEIKRKAETLIERLASDQTFKWNKLVKGKLEELDLRREQIEKEIMEIEIEMQSLEVEKIDVELVKEALRNFLAAFEELNPKEQRDLIKLIIKEVRISPNEITLFLYGKPPVISLVDDKKSWFAERANWLRRQDSNLQPAG